MTQLRPEQLELFSPPAARSPERLYAILTRRSTHPVRLIITRNAIAMASVRFAGHVVQVRLDRAFLAAPDPVIAAIGDYVHSRSRTAWQTICAYANAITPDPHVTRRTSVRSRGAVYDLAAIGERVNQRFFGGKLNCRIGWGRPGTRRRRSVRSRSIRFGSYVKARNLIRIHPILDDHRVPLDFLEYIVFHELLHAAVPAVSAASRRRPHHAAFRALERRYPGLAGMRKLSAELVKTLTASRRR